MENWQLIRLDFRVSLSKGSKRIVTKQEIRSGGYLKKLLVNDQRNVYLDFDTLFPTNGLAKLWVDCKGRVGRGPTAVESRNCYSILGRCLSTLLALPGSPENSPDCWGRWV